MTAIAAATAVADQVAEGAVFMDEHDPGWWREDVPRAINLETLALDQTDRCVLGQRCPLTVLASRVGREVAELEYIDFGEAYYAFACHLSGLSGPAFHEWAVAHGFITADGDAENWAGLTDEWKRAIGDRRAAA
jgi:hypothetical protein